MNRCAPCAQAMLWTYGAGHSTKGVAWCRELCERAVCVAERVNEAPVTAPASPPGRKFHREVLNQCARGGEGADFLTRHSTANVFAHKSPNTSQEPSAHNATSAHTAALRRRRQPEVPRCVASQRLGSPFHVRAASRTTRRGTVAVHGVPTTGLRCRRTGRDPGQARRQRMSPGTLAPRGRYAARRAQRAALHRSRKRAVATVLLQSV